MSIKTHKLIVPALVLIAASMATPARSGSELDREHRVKAAFVYNFIKFVDWPKEKMADANEPIVIGVIGYKGFVRAFDPVKDKKIKNKRISIEYFKDFEKLTKSGADDHNWNQKMEMLKKCHVLLLCTCNATFIENSSQIVSALEGLPVLTVGDTDGFLESGGIINLLKEEDKVRFEVNVAAAKRNKLKISSKLLRLARRVLKENSLGKQES
ncbi:MAG: YfiR family protein [Planctomycetota bacterium]|jgi:hypothetical protein